MNIWHKIKNFFWPTTVKKTTKRDLKYAEVLGVIGLTAGAYPQLAVMEGRDFLRELVRIRDNFTCKSCGKVWIEGQRRFDVHHENEALEGHKGRAYSNNLDFENMTTYCHKCHLNLPHIKKKMSLAMRKGKVISPSKVYQTKQELDSFTKDL